MTTTTSNAVPAAAQQAQAFGPDAEVSFVRPYDAKAAKFEGYTHQIIRYRDTKNSTASKPAKMITVPTLQLPEEWNLPKQAAEVLLGAAEDAVNDILRNLIEEKTVIEWSEITLDKALEFLTATRASSRMTKDGNEAWASVALSAACIERADELSKEKGYNEEKAQLQRDAVLKTYVTIAGKCSAAVPNIGQAEAVAMQNMLARAKIEDDISKAISKKLHAILNPQLDGLTL
jgi:hypothetical protein